MRNFLLNRFVVPKPDNKITEVKIPAQKKILSPIVDPERLKLELLKRADPKPEIKIMDNQLEFIKFENVFEWVNFYEVHKSEFSENQQKPLSTLIDARNLATGGCNCNINTRRIIAADYFKKFWLNNKSTDLLPTLLKITNAKKVLFGDFLSYPS